ncbi:MAG: porin family protein [Zhengella sp.]|uniref:outer membrane protein n=1 Tax=Zhengella sp. TaxID=2282762 RepID=UPI001D2054E1|nr:porin family protein [Notoacmeibacter sp.]MCC0028116.1 porin family protein [Brucellaceae bacterium]
MWKLRSGAILATVAGLAAGSAQAADLYEPEVVMPPPAEPVYVEPAPEVGVSWYIRGDVGYSVNELRGVHFMQGTGAPHVADVSFTSSRLDNSWMVGGGVGVNISRHLRADLTLDYLTKANFRGSTAGDCSIGGVYGNACTSIDTASMSALVVLANAYVDIGTWHGFTAYVGGGIGGAHVKWSKLANLIEPGYDQSGTTYHHGRSGMRFAYALTAGASYCLTESLELDASYRYTRVSGGDMFAYANGGGPGWDRGLDSHAVRAGLRYSFGGAGGSPRCAPEPQVVHYQPDPLPPVYK